MNMIGVLYSIFNISYILLVMKVVLPGPPNVAIYLRVDQTIMTAIHPHKVTLLPSL